MVTMETLLDHRQLEVHLGLGKILELMIHLVLLYEGVGFEVLWVLSLLHILCPSLQFWRHSCWV